MWENQKPPAEPHVETRACKFWCRSSYAGNCNEPQTAVILLFFCAGEISPLGYAGKLLVSVIVFLAHLHLY